MKDKKFEISIILFMVIFSLIIYGGSLLFKYIQNKNTYILITNPYSIFKCIKENCEDVSDEMDDYNNQSYNVYINYIDKGQNQVFYNSTNNTFHVYDTFKNNIYNNLADSLLAYKNANISVIDYRVSELNNSEIDEILLKNEISYIDDVFSQKIILDFDKDGEFENLYLLTNSGYEDKNIYFSILAYKDNNKIYILDKETNDSIFGLYINRLNNVIDVNDNIELIIAKVNCDDTEYSNILYKLKGKSFEKVIEGKKRTIFNYK